MCPYVNSHMCVHINSHICSSLMFTLTTPYYRYYATILWSLYYHVMINTLPVILTVRPLVYDGKST